MTKASRDEILALAAKVEQATEEYQGQLIEQAWEAMAEHSPEFRRFALSAPPRGFDNQAAKFSMALEAMAFESAAMSLVPVGCERNMRLQWTTDFEGRARVIADLRWLRVSAKARTPALALTAAALRAHAEENDDG